MKQIRRMSYIIFALNIIMFAYNAYLFVTYAKLLLINPEMSSLIFIVISVVFGTIAINNIIKETKEFFEQEKRHTELIKMLEDGIEEYGKDFPEYTKYLKDLLNAAKSEDLETLRSSADQYINNADMVLKSELKKKNDKLP